MKHKTKIELQRRFKRIRSLSEKGLKTEARNEKRWSLGYIEGLYDADIITIDQWSKLYDIILKI